MGDESDALWDMAEFDDEDLGVQPHKPRRKVARTKARTTTYGTRGTAQRGATADMRCHCGAEYKAREADLKRGWGLSCSKSCAAIRRDFGRPKAKRISTKEQK